MGGLEYALRNAVERGELASDLDIGATSRALMAHTYGLSALSKSGATIEELRGATRALLERLK